MRKSSQENTTGSPKPTVIQLKEIQEVIDKKALNDIVVLFDIF